MSDYKKFMEELRIQVAEKMGEEYGTEVHQVTKANVGSVDALIVFCRDRTEGTVSPTFYLPPLFYEYREGRKLEDIAEDIKEVYYGQAAEMVETVRNLGNIREYECCRQRIYFRLVNTEKNRAFLEDKVHFEVLDLSMAVYIMVGENGDGIGSVPVQNRLLELWGVTTAEVRKQAEKNTPLLFPEDTAITPKELQEMVAEVNASPAVAEEDILSDSLYYYDREKNELRMAEGCICAG